MEHTLSNGEKIVFDPNETLPNPRSESRGWLRRRNGMCCGTCHYFRSLDNPKAFAEGEGQCMSPWQERDTRSADQSCDDWTAREPERLDMPPSGRKKKREPYAFRPEGGQGHGHLRFRRAGAARY